jgi:hypothetical protein
METVLIVILGTALFPTIGILGGAVVGFRGQIGDIGELRGDIGELRGELHSEIALVRADITRLKERFDEHRRAHA